MKSLVVREDQSVVVVPFPTPCKMCGFNIIVETIVNERILMKLVDVRLDFKN